MYTVNNFNTVFLCIQKYLCHFKFRFTSNFTWSIIGPFVEFWKSPLIASYISLFTLNACLQVQHNMSLLRGYLWSEYSWLYLQSSHPSNQKACHNSKFCNLHTHNLCTNTFAVYETKIKLYFIDFTTTTFVGLETKVKPNLEFKRLFCSNV